MDELNNLAGVWRQTWIEKGGIKSGGCRVWHVVVPTEAATGRVGVWAEITFDENRSEATPERITQLVVAAIFDDRLEMIEGDYIHSCGTFTLPTDGVHKAIDYYHAWQGIELTGPFRAIYHCDGHDLEVCLKSPPALTESPRPHAFDSSGYLYDSLTHYQRWSAT